MTDSNDRPGGLGHSALHANRARGAAARRPCHATSMAPCDPLQILAEFEEGVDAIDFLIESFGFRDREILEDDAAVP